LVIIGGLGAQPTKLVRAALHMDHFMNVHEEYFKTIYDDFAAKISILAKLLQSSPGEQGRFVEKVILELLEEFLPKRYSFGTGFVIDSEGRQSRQCDIVIYDTLVCSGMLSRTGPLFFPVESVYAVIEVKTTLNKSEVADACDHIRSVKHLQNKADPTFDPILDDDGEPAVYMTHPSPPIGIVIGFQSASRSLDTIKSWFMDAYAGIDNALLHPDASLSIQETVSVQYKSTSHRSHRLQYKYYPLPLRNDQGQFLRTDEGGARGWQLETDGPAPPEYVHLESLNGFGYHGWYKVCKDIQGRYTPTDAPRMLVETLSDIASLLLIKRLSGTVLHKYFDPNFGEAIAL
jgi:hypothetical protein